MRTFQIALPLIGLLASFSAQADYREFETVLAGHAVIVSGDYKSVNDGYNAGFRIEKLRVSDENGSYILVQDAEDSRSLDSFCAALSNGQYLHGNSSDHLKDVGFLKSLFKNALVLDSDLSTGKLQAVLVREASRFSLYNEAVECTKNHQDAGE